MSEKDSKNISEEPDIARPASVAPTEQQLEHRNADGHQSLDYSPASKDAA